MQTITIDSNYLAINSQQSSTIDPWLPRIQNNDEYLELGLTFAPPSTNDNGDAAGDEFRPLSDLGAVRLADALRSNTRLLALNLSGNNIGDVGAEALAKALYGPTDSVVFDDYESRSALQSLDLSRNNIGDGGAYALAEALQHNTSLKSLDLSFNEISFRGVVKLLQRLDGNLTLERLNLAGNLENISRENMSELINYLGHIGFESHLEELRIQSKKHVEINKHSVENSISFFGGASEDDLWKLLQSIYGIPLNQHDSQPYRLSAKFKVKNHRLRVLTLPNSTTSPETENPITVRSHLAQVIQFNAFYHPILQLHTLLQRQPHATKYFDPKLPRHLQRDIHSGALIGLLPWSSVLDLIHKEKEVTGVSYKAMPHVLSFAGRECEWHVLWNVMRYRPDVFRYAGRGFGGTRDVKVSCDSCGSAGCVVL